MIRHVVLAWLSISGHLRSFHHVVAYIIKSPRNNSLQLRMGHCATLVIFNRVAPGNTRVARSEYNRAAMSLHAWTPRGVQVHRRYSLLVRYWSWTMHTGLTFSSQTHLRWVESFLVRCDFQIYGSDGHSSGLTPGRVPAFRPTSNVIAHSNGNQVMTPWSARILRLRKVSTSQLAKSGMVRVWVPSPRYGFLSGYALFCFQQCSQGDSIITADLERRDHRWDMSSVACAWWALLMSNIIENTPPC